ncbi:dUTP diphosphatase [Candidatus Parcubacteria bacterium]|nr:MAG: dUTP diphosphatase [Candidatus Parcubacteria bacterium]
MLKIKIKKLQNNCIVPCYAHPGDAGLDLFSLENYSLKPGQAKIFFLGFALEFPKNYVALIKDKGSLGNINKIHTLGGVFDSGYRGEYNACLINLGKKTYNIKKGQKIAQLLLMPVTSASLKISASLSKTSRQEGRFGSTGKYGNKK